MDKVVHFELPADNVRRAKRFYSSVFGWKMNDVPGMNYTLVQTTATDKDGLPRRPGAINGGMQKREEPVKSISIIINVANIDSALRSVQKAGGKVVRRKFRVGQMGYAAYFSDTEGNVIGLWQNLKQ